MGGQLRSVSPPSGFSTLITSAPMSANNMPQKGPAATLQISSTVMPASAELGVMSDLSL